MTLFLMDECMIEDGSAVAIGLTRWCWSRLVIDHPFKLRIGNHLPPGGALRGGDDITYYGLTWLYASCIHYSLLISKQEGYYTSYGHIPVPNSTNPVVALHRPPTVSACCRVRWSIGGGLSWSGVQRRRCPIGLMVMVMVAWIH